MARYFDANQRGKAVSVAALGFPAGEAVFPLMGVGLIAWLGWRFWQMSSLLIVVLLPAALLWLLRGRVRHQAYLAARQAADENRGGGDRTVGRSSAIGASTWR